MYIYIHDRDLRTIEFEARAVFTRMTKMRSKIEGFSRDSRLEFVHEMLVLSYWEVSGTKRLGVDSRNVGICVKNLLEKRKSNNKFLINFLIDLRIEREINHNWYLSPLSKHPRSFFDKRKEEFENLN